MIDIRVVNKVLLTFTIFIFAFIFQYFIDESTAMYMPLVYYMYTIPILLLFFSPIFKSDEILLYVFIISLFLQYFFNQVSFRLSTVLYTVLFVLTFLLYKKLLDKTPFTLNYYKKILKAILFSYGFVLFIQQLSYLLGVIGFNYYFNGPFKFNVLAQETSYIAQIIPVTFYSFIKIRELEWKRRFEINYVFRDKLMWFLFTYISISCGSTSVIVGFLVILFLVIQWDKKKMIPYVIGFVILLPLLFSLLINLKSFERIVDLVPAIVNFDYQGVYDIDSSASARISPYLIYISDFSLFDLTIWFGNGIDYSRTQLTSRVVGYDSQDQGVGGVISFMLDYGLISFVLYLLMLKKYTFKSFKSPAFLLWLFLYSIAGINIYIAWIYPIFIYTNNVIYAKYRKSHIFNSNSNI